MIHLNIPIERALLALTEYRLAAFEFKISMKKMGDSSRDRILESKILLGYLAREVAPNGRLPSPRD
jgi:hypothetical protein